MQDLFKNCSPGWLNAFKEVKDNEWTYVKDNVNDEYINESLFKPFLSTPFEDVKVIFFGKECGRVNFKPTPDYALSSVYEFRKEFDREIGSDIDFARISKQGVLFINQSLAPYNGDRNPWEPILQKLLCPLFERGWIIVVSCYTTPNYKAFIKKLIGERDNIIDLKIKFNKTDATNNHVAIENSNLFIKINKYLNQWCLDEIEW